MKAIILAAGANNEISNVVGDIPKSLITIDGNTILEIQLNVLHSCGIDDVCVVKGYKQELIDIPGVKYYLNEQFEASNILYTLFCAEQEFNDDLLIIYGDTIFDVECLKRILNASGDISIGVYINIENYKKENIENLEIVYFNSDNTVAQISKKLDDGNEAYGQFSGIIKCSKKGATYIKTNYQYFKIYNSNYKNALISELLDNIIALGISISCVVIERGWVKINSIEDYNKFNNNEDGIPNILRMKTDWAVRAQMYDNIQWVNVDEPLEAMVEMSNLNISNPKILDIGIGTGKVLKYFKANKKDTIGYGIDISSEMMDKIDKKYDFNLSVGNVEDLSCFEKDFFDLVTARMSMHHVDALSKAMSEVYRVLKDDASFIICEGVPPTKEVLGFYKEVFSYKETRNTFLVDDLINLMCNSGFEKVTTRTIVVKDMSMNNWLSNSGIPYRNKDIISNLHYNCSEEIKAAYKMKFIDDDILMEWKFVVVSGTKLKNN